MTQIPPTGTIKFYSGIDIRPGRQRIFRTKAERAAYFDAHLVKSFNDMSYIRLGRGIQVESDTLSISQCNYISYKNKAVGGYEDEIFAHIDPNWEYVNPTTVRINFKVDSWITYMFDIEMKEGVVNREHMNETDWTAAVANPYADIFQLQTSEDLPMDQSMERIADASTGDVSLFPSLPQHQSGNVVEPEDMRVVLILGQNDFSQMQPLETGTGTSITMADIIQAVQAQTGGSVVTYAAIQNIPNPCTIFVMEFIPVTVGPSQSVQIFRRLLDLLTFNGMAGNIVGLYWMPQEYVNDLTKLYKQTQVSAVPYQYAPRNPKLYRSPYCYLRVSDDTGQYKHYSWEEFANLVSNGNVSKYVKFDIFFSQAGVPVIFAAPRQYKTILASTTYDDDEMLFTNVDEAIVREDIPQLPFSTDGYLSALGAKYRENWSSNNILKNLKTDAAVSGATDASEGNYNLLNVLGTAANYIRHPYKTASAIADAAGGDVEPLIDLTNQGRSAIKGMLTGTGLNLRKATVADDYNAGASKGWAGYMRAPLRFIFQKVCPREDIVEQYDKYFDYFGYNSGRIGLPYVYNYIKQTGDQPHFATIDNEQVTYCQATISVTLNGKMPAIAAQEIEAMFANGVLFTK